MKLKITGILMTILFLMGCNSEKKTNPDAETTVAESNTDITEAKNQTQKDVAKLENSKWILNSWNGQDMTETEIDQNIFFTLNPVENRVNGFSGCNTFMGTYKRHEDSKISFSKMATTRKMCRDLKIEESEILGIFEAADAYAIVGNTLELKKGTHTLASFKKSKKQSAAITEKYWKLKTLNAKDVTMHEDQEREVYFMLKTDQNRVQGFAGCNTMSGTYTLQSGNRIKFSQMLTTMKACPDVDVDEAAFLKVFELAENYELAAESLTLKTDKKAPLAVFEAIYFN